jgi:molecular chaperone GrpE (heat shock protein)
MTQIRTSQFVGNQTDRVEQKARVAKPDGIGRIAGGGARFLKNAPPAAVRQARQCLALPVTFVLPCAEMSDRLIPKLTKWPFVAGDILLLLTATFLVWQRQSPLTSWECVLCTGIVALGALLCVAPFVLEYRALVKISEADTLAGTLKHLQNLEGIAHNVSAATTQWQGVQDMSTQTLKTAKEMADRMAAEAADFTEFLKKANDSEKATLRLEVEKLHRTQADWLQVAVRTLDHVFALHRAAVRSDRPEVAEQIGHFQDACRDIARRVGLVPFEAVPDETFDAARHKLLDDQGPPPAGARVSETVAAGYRFQGQALRPALVRLKPSDTAAGGAMTGKPVARVKKAMEQSLL